MPDQSDKKVRFLPFHALNEFMTDEYRLEVLRAVFNGQSGLPEEISSTIDRLCKKYVKIPGFRNTVRAPAAMKVKPAAQAFQKSPEWVAGALAAWSEINTDLRQRVHDLLTARGWEMLPIDVDRSKLPGFITVWPKGEDFEVIQAAYAEAYPESPAKANDIALMAVWVTGRLPYQMSEDDQPQDSSGETPPADNS